MLFIVKNFLLGFWWFFLAAIVVVGVFAIATSGLDKILIISLVSLLFAIAKYIDDTRANKAKDLSI
ncbi:hypothetical protein [Campylobacter sp. RM15925]|uniref:hypothetical protein n=1 Tax=Campylobacter sp. RM15925 TaxID=1705724 RepID=UPI001473BB02|nr:hypothetical protein [Campylobacter sp. RM15925]